MGVGVRVLCVVVASPRDQRSMDVYLSLLACAPPFPSPSLCQVAVAAAGLDGFPLTVETRAEAAAAAAVAAAALVSTVRRI